MWVWQICSSPVNGSHLQSPAFSPGSEWKEEKLIQWNKKTLQIYSFCSFHHFILFQNLSVASPSFIPSWIWAYFYQLICCTGGHTWSRWYFFRDLDLNFWWNFNLENGFKHLSFCCLGLVIVMKMDVELLIIVSQRSVQGGCLPLPLCMHTCPIF